MPRIVPLFAQAQTASIVIDGVTYRVPRIDAGGRVYVNAKATDAGEVKTARDRIASSTTRATLATPASGKKIRVLSIRIAFAGATGQSVEVYFGTGADITTTPGKEVDEARNAQANYTIPPMMWPDGGGPVGAADDVLSIRCALDIAETVQFLAVYREE